mmetsp:Transcript_26481/g.63935  ORF Transcript_26481/g.63935 Transcript_26481/m.63935 type:complete len:94 (+) Transcript_26481:1150-1431(+)
MNNSGSPDASHEGGRVLRKTIAQFCIISFSIPEIENRAYYVDAKHLSLRKKAFDHILSFRFKTAWAKSWELDPLRKFSSRQYSYASEAYLSTH